MLRLIAAVQMIQGHSIAAVLAPAYRTGLGFQVWAFARGLTSVIFLFSAGFALALAAQKGHDPSARKRRAVRALRLVLLGYALHAPLGVLLGSDVATALRAWAAVDVLQCIGVSLLSLELLTLAVRAPAGRVALALSLAALCFGLAPRTQALLLDDLTLVPGSYLTASHGSLFPLLPWAGYVFVGFGLGVLSLTEPAGTARRLLRAGALLLSVGLLAFYAGPGLPRAVSPGYALVKLGSVLLLAGLLAHALRKRERLPRWASQLASQTLFLYASHVLLLYADHVGLAALLGARHSPAFGVLLALALLLLCAGTALGLRSLRGPAGSGTRGAPSP